MRGENRTKHSPQEGKNKWLVCFLQGLLLQFPSLRGEGVLFNESLLEALIYAGGGSSQMGIEYHDVLMLELA